MIVKFQRVITGSNGTAIDTIYICDEHNLLFIKLPTNQVLINFLSGDQYCFAEANILGIDQNQIEITSKIGEQGW